VSKEQALSAVADAFEGTPRAGVVTVEDIVRSAAMAAEKQPNRLDRWNTTASDMNRWSLKSHHRSYMNTPRQGGQDSPIKVGAKLISGGKQDELKYLSSSTLQPSISWQRALDAGMLTRDKRMSKIRMMFDALDVDGNHVVSEQEFVTHLSNEGILDKEARLLFREMDDSRSGRLTIAKFDHYSSVHTLAIIRDSFRSLDASKDRQIQRKEFAMFFMGNGLSKAQVSRLWREIDTNSNGKVNFVEFRDWAREALEVQSLDQVAMSLGMSAGG
jgi:Ca2+-binding EF-hand superfamily protein